MADKDRCPVCGASTLTVFLNRHHVPVHQNLIIRDEARARTVARGDLSLAVCHECGFIFNRAFDLANLGYGEYYDNSQMHSPSFTRYLADLVQHLVFERGVQNCRILEVGCGRGAFLRRLVEVDGVENSGHGFDPSYVGPATDLGGRLKFDQRYYGPDCANIPADVVICRHVIEHVPDPLDLLRTIRQALAESSQARVFFETPCAEWILRNHVIWDFFYEHCSLFTAESLTTAFESSGFRVESVQRVFGQQYLWLEATLCSDEPVVRKEPGAIPRLAQQFALAERELRAAWEKRLRTLACTGKVALWGAGAKGVTLANLVDPYREWIDCVVDLNPAKQGCYIPGTGHPIVDYQELGHRNVTTAILMNPNYHDEILALLREAHLDIDLIGGEHHEANDRFD